jgi:hypothetical protein
MFHKNNLLTIIILLNIVIFAFAQTPFKIDLYQSAPEASLFFANPGYLSPALSKGVSSMFSNPAGLGFSSDYELALCVGTPSRPHIKTELKVLDSTEYLGALKVPVEAGIKEPGGFNFIGFSKKLGPLGLGIGISQKSATSIDFDFSPQETLNINYEITQMMGARLPTGSDTFIPLKWTIRTPISLRANGSGGINLGKSPLFLGAGYNTGPLGVGLGFKIHQYRGKLDSDVNLSGTVNVTANGRPESPLIKGSITGYGSLSDTLIKISGSGDFSAFRPALNIGTLLNVGFFKLGLTLEKGFGTELSGDYRLSITRISGPPDSMTVDTNLIYFSPPDSIYGRIRMQVRPSAKTSDTMGGTEKISLPGYTELNLGMSFTILDLYLGATIPRKSEINTGKVGLLLSIPVAPITVRTGFLAIFDYYYHSDSAHSFLPIPLRLPIYAGLGISYNTRFIFLPILPDVQIDLGIKYSPVLLATKLIPSDNEIFSNFETASPLSALSFNLGIGLKI